MVILSIIIGLIRQQQQVLIWLCNNSSTRRCFMLFLLVGCGSITFSSCSSNNSKSSSVIVAEAFPLRAMVNNNHIHNHNRNTNDNKKLSLWTTAKTNNKKKRIATAYTDTITSRRLSRKRNVALKTSISRGGGLGGENDTTKNENDNVITGRVLLLIVALLYGTLNVTLRLVYDLPDPPTAAVLSTTRGWLATICFLPILWIQQQQQERIANTTNNQNGNNNDNNDSNSNKVDIMNNNNNNNNTIKLWTAGFELAFWNFCSQGLINVGLLTIGSARASFFTQTSVVLTPIVSVLFGREVLSWTVWMGCLIALVGLILLSMGGGGAAAAASAAVTGTNPVAFLTGIVTSLSTGDALVLGGALCWSLYLFRLSKLAPKHNELSLQFLKTTLLAIFYTLWAVIATTMTMTTATSTTTMSSIVGNWITNPMAWLILIYSALGPGTIADIIQQQGQKYVNASETNIILSLEPIFAALVAFGLMGETISIQEGVGGGLILLAALIATITQ